MPPSLVHARVQGRDSVRKNVEVATHNRWHLWRRLHLLHNGFEELIGESKVFWVFICPAVAVHAHESHWEGCLDVKNI
eukprot:7849865-Alexandrium_andersonii.AAC.1